MCLKNRKDKILDAGFISIKDLDVLPNSYYKNKVLDDIKEIRKNHNPSIDYGENDSRFSDEYLDFIGGLPIMYPLELMADFIESEAKNNIDNNDKKTLYALSSYIKSVDLYYVFMNIQPYHLGFCAYIILNTKDEKAFDLALTFLDLYKQYYLSILRHDKDELKHQINEHEKWVKSLN